MRTHALSVGLMVFLALSGCAAAYARAPSGTDQCLPASAAGTNLVKYMRRLTSDLADSLHTSTRLRYQLPVVPEGEVSLVNDETACSAAATAFAAHIGADTVSPNPVLVVRVGPTRMVVHDGGASRQGEFAVYLVMNADYVVIASFAA